MTGSDNGNKVGFRHISVRKLLVIEYVKYTWLAMLCIWPVITILADDLIGKHYVTNI